MLDIEKTKKVIHELYNSLHQHPDQSSYLLNITDVLSQVYLKLDTVKNPEAWLSRLVNYIYMEAFSRVHFSRKEDDLLIELGDLSKKSGLNGRNRASFDDKSQFYGLFEKMPRR
ncbi:bacteriocin immunity protein [Companilactobacillus suantsaicola]|uniref:Bacteriocin immunity protein n=1 Tax=Companilactobacillus suantsaicola TaxID=2487723 RepID=A0A4Z0JI21_9LACO|nr:bacteriocin immunity protein [Companilactobacillus suantsaicola]TGD21640.1 bacteriocin immunity protein [Companilactobacillus suantsaicola]